MANSRLTGLAPNLSAGEAGVSRIKFSDNENERAPLSDQFGFFATM